MEQLTGLRRADAAIVGGGLTGLLLASALSQEGLRIAVIDAGSSLCELNAGMAALPCGPLFTRIDASYGVESARQYAAELHAQLQSLLDTPLPYVQKTEVYSYCLLPEELPALEQQQELLARLGVPISVAPDAGGCPFPVELSLMVQGQALVNIARWTSALQALIQRRGGGVFHDSRVIAIDGTRVCTAQGCVDAPHIILTTGKPLGLRDRRILSLLETRLSVHCRLTCPIPLHTCQQSVHAGGLTLIPTAQGALASWDAGRAGTPQQQARLWQFQQVLDFRLPDWQQGESLYSRSVFSADGLPFIGTLPGTRLLFASGYGECSILGAMHAAQVLTRRILGHPLPEDVLYSPDRHTPQKLRRQQLRRLTAMSLRSRLRPGSPHCPHCTCRMRYSTAIQRWECPYCGSAYTMLGVPTAGPTMRSAQVSVRQRPDI